MEHLSVSNFGENEIVFIKAQVWGITVKQEEFVMT